MIPTYIARRNPGILILIAALAGCQGASDPSEEGTAPLDEVSIVDPHPPSGGGVVPSKKVMSDAIASISASAVNSEMQQLVGDIPAQLSSGNVYIKERKTPAGRTNTRKWIRERMVAYGLKTSEHAFSSGGYGTNIEGTIEGTSGRHLYVTAHFDSVTSFAANDNASGTVAILAAARALSSYRPRDSIHFVGFDLEEIGLVGSAAYVREKVLPLYQKNRSQVLGNLNLDMVGYNAGKNRFAVTDCGTAPDLVESALDGIDEADINLHPQGGCAGRSDHASFTKQGIPGVMFMDDTYYLGYPWYHQTTDTLEKVDIAYLTRVSQALVASIVKVAFP